MFVVFVIVERTSKLLFLYAQKQGEMREIEAIHGGPIIARKQERLVFAAGKLDRFACRGIPCAGLRCVKKKRKIHLKKIVGYFIRVNSPGGEGNP